MIALRSCGIALAAALLGLSAATPAAAASSGAPLGWHTFPVHPAGQGDPDRPILRGHVPNPAKPKRDDRVWDWSKSQELHDLPAPPPKISQRTGPSPQVKGGLKKFGANIGDHLKRAPGPDATRQAGQGPASPRGPFHVNGSNMMNSNRSMR
jgi:hypothetical protein